MVFFRILDSATADGFENCSLLGYYAAYKRNMTMLVQRTSDSTLDKGQKELTAVVKERTRNTKYRER